MECCDVLTVISRICLFVVGFGIGCLLSRPIIRMMSHEIKWKKAVGWIIFLIILLMFVFSLYCIFSNNMK